MSWEKLLAEKHVTALPSSKEELDDLRSIVARSLKDVAATGLSADARFVMAYDAARTLALILVRAEGYRPRSFGGHYNTFLALAAVDASFAELSLYFDGCRLKRNKCEYSSAGTISDTDAEELLKTVRQFAVDCEAWVRARHAALAYVEPVESIDVRASGEDGGQSDSAAAPDATARESESTESVKPVQTD